MKRKFFSTLLFGALACATLGTVTSCKDYDDDINNLQEQINKAALSSDVEALKTQVTNAATSAQNAAAKAEEALTKAGTNATEIASVKALATENGTKVATALANAANAAADAQAAAQAAQAAQDSANVALNKIAGLDSELKALAASAQTHVTATQLKASLDSLADVINQALEEREVAEVFVGKNLVETSQLVGDVLHVLGEVVDLMAHAPVHCLYLCTGLQIDDAVGEELQCLVAYLLGVVPVLQHITRVQIVPDFVEVFHQLVVGLLRLKLLGHLRQGGGLQHVDDEHGVVG